MNNTNRVNAILDRNARIVENWPKWMKQTAFGDNMGCAFVSICEDCKVWQYNGYGSYSTWDTGYHTLEEYDKYAEHKDVEKNMNIRHFLVNHNGHKVRHSSPDDWSYGCTYSCDFDKCDCPQGSPIKGMTEVEAPYEFGGPKPDYL